jgi:hypothetical protein
MSEPYQSLHGFSSSPWRSENVSRGKEPQINTGGRRIKLTGTPTYSVAVGSPITSFTITAANGKAPYTYSLASGTFPPGVSINASTGVVGGTPTSSPTPGVPYLYVAILIRATDANGHFGDFKTFSMSLTS